MASQSFQTLAFLLVLCLAVESLNPVVLIPGLGGSQIEARLHRKHRPHPLCWKHSDWYNIWLSVTELLFPECMIGNMRLNVNKVDGTTSNQEGVDIRIPGFGDTGSVEWLDPFHPFREKVFSYYVNLVDRLVGMGYVRGASVHGAPFDFRKAPNELTEYFEKLGSLIEGTYKNNNNSKVVIVGHSLGGNMALHLFQTKSKEWRDKYIATFISLASPWAGSVKALKLLASGDSLGLPKIIARPLNYRYLQQTMPSTIWLMPSEEVWSNQDVLVRNVWRNYTVADYNDFFFDVNFMRGQVVRKITKNLLDISAGPGVRTHCLYGLSENNTPATYIYNSERNNWNDFQPSQTLYEAGDETVSKRSLEVCKDWPNTTVRVLPGVTHLDTVKDNNVIEYIVDVLSHL